MKQVRLIDKKIWVDDQAIPLISGEVHYWRLDPANWLSVLRRVREMGVEVVATYVCWDFHEVEPGQYDFSGETDPRRNLTGFLDLLTEQGFWVILRPGPYIYSEWKNGGVPDRAAEYHRLAPEFQALAQPYIEAVTQAAAPYLATNGGRIILWQADNEIDPWPHWYTEQLGLGLQPGPFHDFLHERYAHISALNEVWGTGYLDFEEARAVSVLAPDQPHMLARYLDFTRFQHWYVCRVSAWAVNAYRALGVNVPICLNAYSGVSTQPWAEMEALADLVGPDIYPSQNLGMRPNEHRTFLEAVRYTRTYSALPYIAEFEAGIWHDWLPDVGSLEPNHYMYICLSALLAGAAGWNWYMLVNRDNWYQSPINEWGRTRPDLFAAFQKIVTLFKELDPTTLTKLTNTAVTYDPLQRGTQRPGQELLQAVYQAGIDYEFFDLSRDEPCSKPLLFYAGGPWLSAEGQQRLIDYIDAGGRLVCLGESPFLDDRLLPLNALQIQSPTGALGRPMNIKLGLSEELSLKVPWMYHYENAPGRAFQAIRLPESPLRSEENSLQFNLQTGQTYAAGYTQARGPGSLTVIGLPPSPELVAALHKEFGINIPVRSRISGVSAALFQRGVDAYLVAVNSNDTPTCAVLDLSLPTSLPRPGQAQQLATDERWEFSSQITLTLPGKDGTIVHLKGAPA